MRTKDFFENDIILGFSRSRLDENVINLVDKIQTEIGTLESEIESDPSDKNHTASISQLVDEYSTVIPIASIVATIFERYKRGKFTDVYIYEYIRILSGLYKIMTQGTVPQIAAVMTKRFNAIMDRKSKDPKHHVELENIQREIARHSQDIVKGVGQSGRDISVRGGAALEAMSAKLNHVYEILASFMRDYPAIYKKEKEDLESPTVAALEYFKWRESKGLGESNKPEDICDDLFEGLFTLASRGLLSEGDSLVMESKEGEEPESVFYAIVSASIEIDGKNHRNFRSIAVARAKSAVEASGMIQKNIKASVSQVNKELKKDNKKIVIRELDKLKILTHDELKKKNIGNLVGSEYVSSGIIVLRGVDGHGDVKSTVWYAPLGHVFFNKSSITRYLNKGR